MAEIIFNRPNWLGSEEGLVRKTITVPTSSAVVENGRNVVKSGTYINDTVYGGGLLFGDVDVTDGVKEGSLMIGGYYIDAKLPQSVATYATTLAQKGLHAIELPATTRPNFGGNV